MAANLFSALGDETRLHLLSRLGRAEKTSIAELGEGLQLSRQGISKHLRVLENAGIVSSEKVGRETQFSLKPESLDPMREYLQLVSTQWDEAITRLQTFVEDEP